MTRRTPAQRSATNTQLFSTQRHFDLRSFELIECLGRGRVVDAVNESNCWLLLGPAQHWEVARLRDFYIEVVKAIVKAKPQ